MNGQLITNAMPNQMLPGHPGAFGLAASFDARPAQRPAIEVARVAQPRGGLRSRQAQIRTPERDKDASESGAKRSFSLAADSSNIGGDKGFGLPVGASAPFLAQLLAQEQDNRDSAENSGADAGLLQYQNGMAHGSDAYRRSGGSPPIYAEDATFLRLSV